MRPTGNLPVVADASVAVKWLLEEEFSDRARALYRHSVRDRTPIQAPALLPNEVFNALYQQVRRGHLLEADADAAVARFSRFDVDLVMPRDLPARAYVFAKRHRLRAIYDSLYVLLAQQLGAELWTADRRLFDAVSPVAPWVRWLGDYPES